MAMVVRFGDLLQELQSAGKSGALYVSIRERSEDMARFYFQKGDICHIRYGSAIGGDCLDILQYYTLDSASFFDGIRAPGAPAKVLPATGDIIARFQKDPQSVRAKVDLTDL